MTVKQPKNRHSTSAERRSHSPVRLWRVYERAAQKPAITATGFHSSRVSHGATPSAVTAPEITTAGWK